jgi:hypothetical protein
MDYKSAEVSKKIKLAVKQLNGSVIDGTDADGEPIELLPEIAIGSGEGYLHCYCPVSKRFVKISKGQKAYIIDDMDNNKEKCLIYTWDGFLVEISRDEIMVTGFD